MKKINKLAFTLVELLVTIIIISFLSTIAFISLSGFTESSRNSLRITDLENIKKSLDVYAVNYGSYPIPTNSSDITYNGGLAWKQGTLGDSVIQRLQSSDLNKKPVDPLTKNEYTYSLTNSKKEFSLGSILEKGNIVNENLVLDKVNAKDKKDLKALIIGNYNGKILKVSTGGIEYILAVPSIINGDMTLLDLDTIISLKKLVYNGYTTLPSSYNFFISSNPNKVFDYNPTTNLLIYTGTELDLINSQSQRLILLNNIQNAYSGTIVSNDSEIKGITDTITNLSLPTNDSKNLSDDLVILALDIEKSALKNISDDLPIQTGPFSCFTQSGYLWDTCNGIDEILIGSGSNSQCWKDKNVGATVVYNGQIISGIPTTLQRTYIGNHYQWDKNTTEYTTGTLDMKRDWRESEFYTPDNMHPAKFAGINTWCTLPKGPCDAGFHVPTQLEWQKAYDILSTRDNFVNTLKLPMAGYYERFDSNTYVGTGWAGAYWSSTSSTNSTTNRAYNLYFTTYVNPVNTSHRAFGFPIRCIKD